ncbi:MAG: hypothetical protein WEC83_00210 [Patescibacteria group bacterium]
MKRWALVLAFLAAQLLALLPAPVAQAASASYYFSPSTVTVNVGQSVTVSLFISTDSAVNSGSGTIVLPTSYATATAISKSGSIFTLWTTEPSISGSSISFGGGLANPGYTGSSGKVLSFTVRGQAEGTGLITMNSGQILANDGAGTNIHSGSSSSTVNVTRTVSGAAIASETHPEQSRWYNSPNVKLSWSSPSGVSSYSYTLSKPGADTISRDNVSGNNAEFNALADGVWTFKLTTKYSDGKSAQSSFVIQIDTVAPTKPAVTVTVKDAKDQYPKFEMSSTDETSGVDYYEIIIDNGEPIRATENPYTLPKQLPGNHNYQVIAVDKAGNKSEVATGTLFIEGVPGPKITSAPAFVAMLQPIKLIGTALYGSIVQIYIDDVKVHEFLVSEHLSDQQERKSGGYKADDEVEWQITIEQNLPSGVKAIYATQTTSEGNDSFKSNTVNVRILAGWISLGGLIIPMAVLFWVSLLLLILLAVLVVYLWKRYVAGWKKRLDGLREKVDNELIELKKEKPIEESDVTQTKEEIDQDFEETK